MEHIEPRFMESVQVTQLLGPRRLSIDLFISLHIEGVDLILW